ncbi:MAG: hypothetical protein HZA08_04955 [Nitrospirae bacterium]|nr:hypothetical protein [Nitrospirota bacterium]
MPYLNLDLDYFNHPKTRRLIGLLGRGSEAFPLRLWCYCGKYHPGDGRLSDYSVQEIESILEFNGENGKLVEALIKVGFLHKDSNSYYVHDWNEHSGHIAALKEKAIKAAKTRWNNINNQSIDTNNAPSIARSQFKHCSIDAPTRPTNKDFLSDSSEVGLSKLLFSLVRIRNPGFKEPNLQAWAKHIDLIIRVDKRVPSEIEQVIRWCQKDTFWQNNILSTEKLRKQYDQLKMKMNGNEIATQSQEKQQANTALALPE